MDLTDKQCRVLRFLFDQLLGDGKLPTVRDVGEAFEISIGSVQRHIDALVKSDYLRRSSSKRGFALNMERVRQLFGIPVVGRVSAGLPQIADAEVIETLTPDDIFPKEANFALIVKGESMSNTLMPGDRVFIKETREATPGDIVVAFTDDDEGVIKRLVEEEGKRFLKSDNPHYPAWPFEQCQIVGKVVARWRRF